MSSAPDSATPAPLPAAVQEPCPTPLEWRTVLEEFRRLRRAFRAHTPDGGLITGTTFGSGPPLYILRPAAGDNELFALLAWLLKDERCSVFVEPPPIQWPVRCLAELQRQSAAVLAAADELRHDRLALLGVAAGGATALDLCLNAPERVDSLALLQGSARLTLSWLERGLYSYGSLLPGTLGAIPSWRGLQQRNHRAWFPPFDASRFDFLVQNLARSATAQTSRRMLLWAGLDFRPQLSAIRSPVLLMHTEGAGRPGDDGIQELHSGLPQAQLESLHSTGRHACLTHPHRVAKLIRTFLDSAVPRDRWMRSHPREGEAPAEPMEREGEAEPIETPVH